MQSTAGGMCLLILAGVMNASFSLPMKFVRSWAWENTWLLWTIFALLVLPPALAFSTIPSFASLLHANGGVVLLVAVCGAAWGIAQVLFGLALDKIGIALTFSIVLGLSAAMGSLIPLLRLHSDRLFTRGGIMSLAGIALVLIGVAASAVAGKIRDRGKETGTTKNAAIGVGLVMAIVSGVCASMMNVGFAYGAPLAATAGAQGANSLWVTDAVWVPLMAGGAVPNVLYCIFLLTKRKTATNYSSPSFARNLSLTFAMGILWFGSSVLYGIATAFLGVLGPVVGWPLFMSLIVIIATLLGLWTGEWRGAAKSAFRVQGFAVAVLVAAVIVLSRASF
ncbi:MAG TPA: L-rhamnose/proton symporter RhaT [Acidobacteriaceae bacterium]|nr:L-rhamnose/proton symporter RhaT [Acidobacteriaceae bacterium]